MEPDPGEMHLLAAGFEEPADVGTLPWPSRRINCRAPVMGQLSIGMAARLAS